MMYASYIHLVRLPESACLYSFLMFNYVSTFPFAALNQPLSSPYPPSISSISLFSLLLLHLPKTSTKWNKQPNIHSFKIHVYVDIVKVLMDEKGRISWIGIKMRMFIFNH